MAEILIVDDMEQYIDSIERVLYRHTVVRATSLAEAQRVCSKDVNLALFPAYFRRSNSAV